MTKGAPEFSRSGESHPAESHRAKRPHVCTYLGGTRTLPRRAVFCRPPPEALLEARVHALEGLVEPRGPLQGVASAPLFPFDSEESFLVRIYLSC